MEEIKLLQLKIPRGLIMAFKMQAIKEERSMSEIAGELITGYLKKKGG